MSDELMVARLERRASDWMVMPLLRYADFAGRSQRAEFLGFFVLNAIVTLSALAAFLIGLAVTGEINFFILIPLVIYSIATLIPRLALTVRRHHDQGRSGWWLLIGLAPYVGPFIELGLMLSPGVSGPNQYGEDPRGLDAARQLRALEAPRRVRGPAGLIAD